MDKRVTAALSGILIAVVLASGCGTKKSGGEEQPQGGKLKALGMQNGQIQPQGNMKALAYTDEHYNKIREASKAVEMKTVYVPQNGANGDKLDWVEVDSNVMILHYKKMDIIEYQKEVKPTGRVSNEQDVKLLNGDGKWYTIGKRQSLRMKLPEAYVIVSSQKGVPREELERVAESLFPVVPES
ncbi:hypothetical protein [Paenibacillus contaminans]|uniref:DUF4367 domain-containing protein n=1 Tax=Paenibacillus contaminans TaxID=450362 RepID=A0A329MRF8_9BACL|nr:hypothetical protein [Paenibacillus contaminans]RAV21926.1 hypothetical protein DQG23_07720 [Paenibacillus contaminans]